MKNSKYTFEDLVFGPHPSISKNYFFNTEQQQAKMFFSNGYGVSVLLGDAFYSNGKDTYELAVIRGESICYDTPVTDDVLGWLTKEEVTDAMIKVQDLEPFRLNEDGK